MGQITPAVLWLLWTFTVLLPIFQENNWMAFTCFFPSTHLMFTYETLLNANCCSCTFQGLLFITVWNCLSNVLCISIFNWSDLCLCEIQLNLLFVTLGDTSFFWVWYYFPPSFSIWQACKLPMINCYIYLLVQVCYWWIHWVIWMPPYRWHRKFVETEDSTE